MDKRNILNENRSNAEINSSGKKIKNPWMLSTFVFGVITLILLFFVFRGGVTGEVISENEARNSLISYLNAQTGGGVSYVSAEDLGNLYQINVNYQNQEIPVFITKDGKYFVQGAVPITGNIVQDIPSQPTSPSAPIDVSVDDDAVKGDSNAPVIIIEFSDYECPFCGRYFQQTYPQIVKEYVDTGKVKIVFRDFPLSFHENAQKAGEAAECAGEQGKYWEMHDKLFENQQALGIVNLKQYAKELGLNTKAFDDCLDSGKMASEIQKDFEDGQNAGVSGTPAFFINGIALTGAQPFEAFKQIIEQELNK